jgi:BirA family biotin operon repressor/biotin-[acetyl-CoA-carboxylase] ligase
MNAVTIGNFSVVMMHFPEIDSTQTYIRSYLLNDFRQRDTVAVPVRVVSADHQTHGRGKGDRKWFSDKTSKCIALSLSFPVSKSRISRSAMLTQILALATVRSLLQFLDTTSTIAIKWPNDILIDGKKIGGILGELEPIDDGEFVMIIGVGINIDIRQELLDDMVGCYPRRWPATSIKQTTGEDISPTELRDCIITEFLKLLEDYLEREQLPISEIQKHQFMFGKILTFSQGDHIPVIVGTCEGVDEENGGLKIRSDDGTIRTFFSGEIIPTIVER